MNSLFTLPLLAIGCAALIGCEKESIQKSDTAKTESFTKSNFAALTREADEYDALFTRYGNGWTGGDGAYSIPLPDGRILWMFGDTFLDTVYADRSRPFVGFARNSFVIQDGSELTTLPPAQPGSDGTFISPPNDNKWYWPGDGTAVGDKLYVLLQKYSPQGSGPFGFANAGTDLATFSLPDMNLLNIRSVWQDEDVLAGISVYEEFPFIYIYNSKSSTFQKDCPVARLNVNSQEIEYLNASGNFSSSLTDTGFMKLTNGNNLAISNMLTVFRVGSNYVLLTQDDFFGANIHAYKGSSPIGPWGNKTLIYTTPESGGNIWTYNAILHPHIRSEANEILLSYSVNSMNFGDLFADADNYRPWFVWVNPAALGAE